MEVKAARRVPVFDRVGSQPARNEVCTFWLAGKCNRNPCRFMHRESPPPQSGKMSHSPPRSDFHRNRSRNLTWKKPNNSIPKTGNAESSKNIPQKVSTINRTIKHNQEIMDVTNEKDESTHALPNDLETDDSIVQETLPSIVQETLPKQCKNWLSGNCSLGEKCADKHCWFYGSGFTMLGKLEGHGKAVSGICLPSGHTKLYSGGEDGCVRAWDCYSGQCSGLENLNSGVRCMVTEGQWLFVGLHDAVKAWNFESQSGFTLNTGGAVICSMAADDNVLFAGTEHGSILVWRWQSESSNAPEPVALLKEHTGAVCSLVVGSKRLYSGSKDSTIKQWDVHTLQCLQTLHGHTSDVTAVLCWDYFLLSASLDKTIKVWATSENETIEMIYEMKNDNGVIALAGIHASEAKPILLCSYTDNTARLFELPTFSERGRIFSRHRIEVIRNDGDVEGLFFTGDAAGELVVWKML
ncbi:zinc finger CCCH domain-containing protein 48-like [Andrographis paniculata]|uniref:zinc finger CCCH domain-containing protein 48-like n=1 Tax=Andrographis paniculata TaxID=175694 RepID=UPI0021E72F75|nr:zinc finger CCCH domain-containing protein 48-like [Andrographis paniculata]XP_051116674.1 zinc finger CCCH domain-containing protein 48-like [Andrographis paniculata]